MKESYVMKYIEKMYHNLCEYDEEKDHLFFIFRGHANYNWTVCSSAHRRLQHSKVDGIVDNATFIAYNQEIIQKAREMGYGFNIEHKKKKNDLQVLADIQHYGGATCLTDFTTNFLTALWFASDGSNPDCADVEGQIVLLNVFDRKNNKKGVNNDEMIYIIDETRDDKIDSLLKKQVKYSMANKIPYPRFWLWKPSNLNTRILMQDSIFLFGVNPFSMLSSVTVNIEVNDKKYIQKELRAFFSKGAYSIFFDVQGFSREANGVNLPIVKDQLSGNTCMENANLYYKLGKYDLAIEKYSKIVACFSDICKKDRSRTINDSVVIYYIESLISRGFAYLKIRDSNENKLHNYYYNGLNDFEIVIAYYYSQKNTELLKKYPAIAGKTLNGKLDALYMLENYNEAYRYCMLLINNYETIVAEYVPDIYHKLIELGTLANKDNVVDYKTALQIYDKMNIESNPGIKAFLTIYKKINKWKITKENNVFYDMSNYEEIERLLLENDEHFTFQWNYDPLLKWAEMTNLPKEGIAIIEKVKSWQGYLWNKEIQTRSFYFN
jgi:tetratricopeptide (TPR) repeat protein